MPALLRNCLRGIAAPLLDHRTLVVQLTRRGVQGRYRGSVLGAFWTLITPLLMLLVYSFVFSVVFKAKWNHSGAEDANFGVILFSGMIVHALFTEPMVTSPGAISGNAQYVKKVVFPLETLAWSHILMASVQAFISLFVLMLFMLVSGASLHPTILLTPLVVAPMLLFSLGVAWFLSSTAVFLPDLRQLVGIIATVLLFVSPVFYPVDLLPAHWQPLLYLNPISFIVDQVRAVAIYGEMPNWSGLLIYSGVAWLVACLGLGWFNRLRAGFADVL